VFRLVASKHPLLLRYSQVVNPSTPILSVKILSILRVPVRVCAIPYFACELPVAGSLASVFTATSTVSLVPG